MSVLHASVGTGVIPVLLVTNPQQQAPCKDQNADKLNTGTADVLNLAIEMLFHAASKMKMSLTYYNISLLAKLRELDTVETAATCFQ